MRAFLLLIGLLAASAALAGPFDAVGRLEKTSTNGTCTASLIAANIVATAAHCISEDGAGDFVFRLGNGLGTPTIPVIRAVRHPFYTEFVSQPLRRLRFDIALAELAEPVDAELAQPLKLGEAARAGEGLFLVSWRAGEGSRPRQRRCLAIEGELPGVVTLGCRVQGGESGAPVTRLTADGLELVAIINSRSEQGRQPIAIASDVILRIPPLLDRLKRNP